MSKKDRSGFKNRQFYKDDRGSTLVVVVLSMLLLCVLASVILYTTYINYSIKTTELRSTDNFYTAEAVMEEIKAGLEREVSGAYAYAYLEVMTHYGSSDTDIVIRTSNFRSLYTQHLKDALILDGQEDEILALLLDYLTSKKHTDTTTATAGEAKFEDGSIAHLEFVKEAEESKVWSGLSDGGVSINGLRLTYTDSKGYVAVITTDIALRMPNMTFEEQNNLPGVLSYALIANKKLYFGTNTDNTLAGGTFQVAGSVYGGLQGISVGENSTASFVEAEPNGTYLVVTGGDIEVQSGAELATQGNVSLWADGIEINSSSINLSGESYMQDDLTVNGKGSSVTLAGSYRGYGYNGVSNVNRTPDNSSSILINGAETDLDFSRLTELSLAGQAYIGTTDADDDGVKDEGSLTLDGEVVTGEDGTSYNVSQNQDVRMGESLSVKSNQLAYLVPAECIGYIGDKCLLGANPISLSQYMEFQQENSVGVPIVDLKRAEVQAEDGTMRSLEAYGASWRQVFYQASSGTAWVYFYLTFDSATLANQYFWDCYNQEPLVWNRYMTNYLSDYIVPDFMQLNLAGNAVYYDNEEGNFILQRDTSTSASSEDALTLITEYTGYSNTNKALNINLTTNYAALNEEIDRWLTWDDAKELGQVFPNIVIEERLLAYMDTLPAYGGNANVHEVTASGGQKVLLIRNEGGEAYTIPSDSAIKVVIATGDVVVGRDYKGMILSGGQIFVINGARVAPDPEEVSYALQADSGRLLNCFWDGTSVTEAPTPGEEESDVIGTDELVVYRNWKKD